MDSCEYEQIEPRARPTPAPTPPTRDGREERRRPRRRWEVFPGKNRFCCGGRVIMARQSGVFPLTLGLILLTCGLFFIFDCPFLVQHLTSCIPAIGGVLFLFVLLTLLRTSFSDPGILPRATPDEAAEVEKQIDGSGNASYRPPPRTLEVAINQQPVKLKYCFTCRMFRPPRTSHCSLCDNCVERFDHHCPWVGNCVGKRNYRFFFAFIVSLSFLTAFIFGCVATHLALRAQGGRGLVFALQESPGSAVELAICFFSVWSILGLSGFHTYLVASNVTTNEDVRELFLLWVKGARITRRFSVPPVTDQRLVVGEERGGRRQPVQPPQRRPQLLRHPLRTHAPQFDRQTRFPAPGRVGPGRGRGHAAARRRPCKSDKCGGRSFSADSRVAGTPEPFVC